MIYITFYWKLDLSDVTKDDIVFIYSRKRTSRNNHSKILIFNYSDQKIYLFNTDGIIPYDESIYNCIEKTNEGIDAEKPYRNYISKFICSHFKTYLESTDLKQHVEFMENNSTLVDFIDSNVVIKYKHYKRYFKNSKFSKYVYDVLEEKIPPDILMEYF